MEPQIRFCTSADGTRIAYATLGEGPPLVEVLPWGGSLEQWEHPEIRAFTENLARGRLLAWFDRRGVGVSQRAVEDLFGAAVNLAARICAQAEPGQILAPIVVRELTAGKQFLFADRGDTVLRGFEDPVRLYEVSWRDEG